MVFTLTSPTTPKHAYLPRRKANTAWKVSSANMKLDKSLPLLDFIDNDVGLVPIRVDELGEYHIKLTDTTHGS